MKRNQALVLAAVAVLLFGLAFSAAAAQEKSRRHNHMTIDLSGDWSGLDKADLKELRKLESLKDLGIHIRGLKDLEKGDRLKNLHIDIDFDGLRESLEGLGHLGERIGREIERHFDGLRCHDFRKAMRILKNLKIDLDLDLDIDID
jgi:hypothetical protein